MMHNDSFPSATSWANEHVPQLQHGGRNASPPRKSTAAAGAVHMLAQAAANPVGGPLPGSPCQTYALPVDAEFKACRLDLCSVARPHMRAFHINWIAFFCTFLATFAPAALLPVLRDDLGLTNTDIGNGGIASVCGAIFSRLLMGTFVDMFGPRYGAAAMLLGTAPFVFSMAIIQNAAGFIAMRMMVGLSLSMFVVNQTWTTHMFNVKLIGRANALSAGWGNTGAGASLLLMPLLYEAFATRVAPDMAWRLAMFVPGVLQLLLGVLVLTSTDDLPTQTLQTRGDSSTHRRPSPCAQWQSVVLNYRCYVVALAYALSFGVELTTHNVISLYLFSHFGLSLTAAGVIGGVLGLMNVGSRFLGGAASDLSAHLRGMRGRLWVLQLLLLLEGVFCLLVGLAHGALAFTVGMLFVFSFFCQMACGAVFGIVPFVSKRSTGTVVGIVAGGGSLGSAVTQAIFFSYFDFTTYEGFYWMGTSIICLGAFTSLLYWPMWGGMFCGAQSGMSEERYYMAEYSGQERAAGLHVAALAFAHESRSERNAVACCGQACALPFARRRQQQQQQQARSCDLGGRSTCAGGSSHSNSRTGILALPQYLQSSVPLPSLPPAAPAASVAHNVQADGVLPDTAAGTDDAVRLHAHVLMDNMNRV